MAQATKQDYGARHGGAMKLATFEPSVERVSVAKIRVDGGTQMRAGLNAETVADYAAAMGEYGGWGKFEPIEVYHDGSTYWLADGFHRVAAAKEAGVELADAKIHAGDQRKAILHAAGANADHGLRRSNADKRRAVVMLLRDPEWAQWSDAEIARTCRVDGKTVGNIRRELVANLEIPDWTARVTADGHTVNTANVGAKPAVREVKAIRDAHKPPPAPAPAKVVYIEPKPEPTADPVVADLIALDYERHEFEAVLVNATVAQLETALHAIPTTDKWRWLKIGNRRELLITAQNLGVMDAPEPTPEPAPAAPTMPTELAAAGYRLLQVDSSYWVWEIGDGDETFRGNWMPSPATAIEDAQADYIGNLPADAEPTPDELAAMAAVAAELAEEDQDRAAREATRLPAENASEPRALVDPFDAWLNAMPSNLNLRECALILDVAKTTAKHVLELQPGLYNAVYGALPTWSHLIREVGKAAGR